jgi:hypothetical protein
MPCPFDEKVRDVPAEGAKAAPAAAIGGSQEMGRKVPIDQSGRLTQL